MSMRRVMAAFLLICLGVVIPLAGSPVRICQLDGKLLLPGMSECSRDATKAPCCPGSGEREHEESPCCLAIDELPDATPPVPGDPLPAAIAMDLPEPLLSIPDPALAAAAAFRAAVPIRGPDSPAARRAMFGVWRL